MSAYRSTAWSWSRHLWSGGSCTWSDWVAGTIDGTDAGDPVPAGWSVPGAAQLELVRRLAERGTLTGDAFVGLADLVASRSGPGRGLAQQPLPWPCDVPVVLFGAPPVDPSDVPLEELVRIGVGTLTELLLASPGTYRESTSARRRPLTRTPSFVLAGAPVTTSAVRRELGVAGHAEGGRSPRVVLLAEPFDRALAQAWSARVQRGAPLRWPGFVDRWAAGHELPPSADLPAIARRWVDRVGRDEVHVVVAPDGAGAATRTVAGILGVSLTPRRGAATAVLQPRWKDLTPAAVDLVRRVSTVLAVRVAEERRTVAVRELVAALQQHPGPRRQPLTVPAPFRGWAGDQAERLADELSAGGYPVHGPLERLLPQFEGRPTRPRRRDVLAAVVDVCLGQASAAVVGSSEET